jgi:hypothetical protein
MPRPKLGRSCPATAATAPATSRLVHLQVIGREQMAITADIGYSHGLEDTFQGKAHHISFGCSKARPRYHVTKIRRVTAVEWHGIPAGHRASGVLEHRNGADERAERCTGAFHVRALQRSNHLGDSRSIGLLRRDLPCQLVSRLAAGTTLQVRFPGAQVFDDLAQGPGAQGELGSVLRDRQLR